MQFLAALNLFLGGKEKISKDALTEVYHNFQALCVKETSITLEFEKITKVATEIN